MADCLDSKTKLFALRVIKLSRYLMEDKKEYILSKQFCVAEQALVQMYEKEKMHKANSIS